MSSKNWQDFVDEHYKAIFRFCYQFLGNKQDAEDATQQTFLKAFKSCDNLSAINSDRAWIYSVARNVCIDRKRSWKSYLNFIGLYNQSDLMDRQDDLSLTLRVLINKLPLKQREVFILRHWHDFSTEETGKLLGINSGTVKSHLKRAVDCLKIELTKDFTACKPDVDSARQST